VIPFCLSIYRRLARAYPHEFQIVYGADLVQLGEDAVEEIAREHGALGLVRLLADLAWRVPVEYLSEMRQDLIYTARMLAKSPGIAVAAVVSLGLGIGVPTAGFSEINALLFRDLPGVKDPDRLLTTEEPVSYAHFERYRDHRDLFSGVTAYVGPAPFHVLAGTETERVMGQLVSPEYFDVLGLHAMRGSTDGVVISERFWKEKLNGDRDAVGKMLRINGHAVTIAGVGPRDFLGARPIQAADIFVPMDMRTEMAPELNNNSKEFLILMRLQRGVAAASANAAAETIARQLDGEGFPADARKGQHVRLLPGGGTIPRSPEMLPVLLAFLGTLMAVTLGITCTNLATMLLARSAGRRKEVAIRLAVGASRFRLIRQLLTESVVLSLLGGAAGFGFAYWLMSAATKMYRKFPMTTPVDLDLRPDWRVFVFTFALAVTAGLLLGLAPALAATKGDYGPALKEGAVTPLRGYKRFGLRNLLMVYQVAASLMLLILTGFIVLGFSAITKAEATFDTARLYLMTIDPVRDGYAPGEAARLFAKLRQRLQGLPAVENSAFSDASAADVFPTGSTTFTVPASGNLAAKIVKPAVEEMVGANYFATLGVKMLAGREFTARDEESTPGARPAVINARAAEAMFGAANPIGRHIEHENETYEVVGIAPELRGDTFGVKPSPEVWVPLTAGSYARPPLGGVTLMIRASSAGGAAVSEVREQIAALDPKLTVFQVRTMQEGLDRVNDVMRSSSFVYGGFGVFGLILASVGLAGVTAYSVAQRRKEIGIRMALGARQGQVLRLVMKEGAALVMVGWALGFAGAWVIGRALAAMSPDLAEALGAKQPRLMIGAPLLLAALTMLACWIPARKSVVMDPLTSLRQE
jgi:putative ABC transport system permease protein